MSTDEEFNAAKNEEIDEGNSDTYDTELSEEPIFTESLEEGQEDPIAASSIEQAGERPIGVEEQKTIKQQEKYSKPSKPSGSSVSALENRVMKLSNQLAKQSDVNELIFQHCSGISDDNDNLGTIVKFYNPPGHSYEPIGWGAGSQVTLSNIGDYTLRYTITVKQELLEKQTLSPMLSNKSQSNNTFTLNKPNP